MKLFNGKILNVFKKPTYAWSVGTPNGGSGYTGRKIGEKSFMAVRLWDDRNCPYVVDVPMKNGLKDVVGKKGKFYWDDEEFCWQFHHLK